MKCVLKIYIGDECKEFDLISDQDSYLSDDDIYNALSSDEDKRENLCKALSEYLYANSIYKRTSVSDLTKNHINELVGNCGIEYLKNEFPEVEFPEGVEAKVLLLKTLAKGGKNIYGRTITSNGNELFIIDGSKNDVYKLANFLKFRKIIEDNAFKFSEESKYYKDLVLIQESKNKHLKKRQIHNISELLLDFIYNNESYRKMYLKNSKDEKVCAYNVLKKTCNTILSYTDRITYNDPFVNTLNIQLRYNDDNTKSISIESVYSAVKAYHSDILKELEINKENEFTKFFSEDSKYNKDKLIKALTKDNSGKVFDEIIEDKPGFATLFNYLFSAEPEYNMSFYKIENKNDKVYFKSVPKTIQLKYGIEYETIHLFEIEDEDYQGFKIYKQSEEVDREEDENYEPLEGEQEIEILEDENKDQKYIYKYQIRKFGIGNQPDGGTAIDEETVQYDRPLTNEQIKNFSLIPITDAENLIGKSFEYKAKDGKITIKINSVDDSGNISYTIKSGKEKVDETSTYLELQEALKGYTEKESKKQKKKIIRSTKTYYYYNQGYMTEDSLSSRFESIDEVKEKIEKINKSREIGKYSLLEFKVRDVLKINNGEQITEVFDDELSNHKIVSNQYLIPGSIIESIDVPIANLNRYLKEQELLNKNYESFKEVVKSWHISNKLKESILTNLNTPEKIAIFIYKINELLGENRTGFNSDEEIIEYSDNIESDELKEKSKVESTMNQIINQINTAKRKNYYIESSLKYGNRYNYTVIPTNPNQIEEYKSNKKIPVISLMNAISKVFNDKFGVVVNLKTSEELEELFPELDILNAKAFINNGEIYINTTLADSSDLLHEYTHLILGVLKTIPELRNNYEALLNHVYSTKEGQSEFKRVSEIYTSESHMDLLEEMFARLFSKHLQKNLGKDLEKIFSDNDETFKDVSETIFGKNIEDISNFYQKSIQNIFIKFSKEVGMLLQSNSFDFSTTQQYRKKSNWISEQIKNGNIKEENCI